MDAYTYLTGKQYEGFKIITGYAMKNNEYELDDYFNIYPRKRNKTNYGSKEIFESSFIQDGEEDGGEI